MGDDEPIPELERDDPELDPDEYPDEDEEPEVADRITV